MQIKCRVIIFLFTGIGVKKKSLQVMLANYGSHDEVTQTIENPEVQISQGLFALLIGLWLEFKWQTPSKFV